MSLFKTTAALLQQLLQAKEYSPWVSVAFSLAHNIQNKKAICCGDVARCYSADEVIRQGATALEIEQCSASPICCSKNCSNYSAGISDAETAASKGQTPSPERSAMGSPAEMSQKTTQKKHVGSNCTNFEHVRRFWRKHSIIP